jgi:hypothetical protein
VSKALLHPDDDLDLMALEQRSFDRQIDPKLLKRIKKGLQKINYPRFSCRVGNGFLKPTISLPTRNEVNFTFSYAKYSFCAQKL